ncbi:histidinol-phosphatase [Endothiovibrio diazotrophicus]
MSLAIFDLDNTLLGGDSDYQWARFLVERGLVDAAAHGAANQRFMEQYEAGTLDIHEFLAFQLHPLSLHRAEQLDDWHREFMEEKIRPLMLPKAVELVDRHRSAGDTLMIITATNRFITGPIAAAFGIEHLIATEAELVDGRYTGRSFDTPCFQAGKITRLERWLGEHDENLAGSWFYSDSRNDIPLLERVENPVAVDPDAYLAAEAQRRGWPVISLRG